MRKKYLRSLLLPKKKTKLLDSEKLVHKTAIIFELGLKNGSTILLLDPLFFNPIFVALCINTKLHKSGNIKLINKNPMVSSRRENKTSIRFKFYHKAPTRIRLRYLQLIRNNLSYQLTKLARDQV